MYLRYICFKKIFIQNVIFHKLIPIALDDFFSHSSAYKNSITVFLQVQSYVYASCSTYFSYIYFQNTIHTFTIHWMDFMFFIYCTEKKNFSLYEVFFFKKTKINFPFIGLHGNKFKWFRCFKAPLHFYEHFLIVSGYFWSRFSRK